jgi:hypothetical protein
MWSEYDPQHEAETAMKQAAASEGDDRQRLIQLALAWHQLARDQRGEQASEIAIDRSVREQRSASRS